MIVDTLNLLRKWAGKDHISVGGYEIKTELRKLRLGPLSPGFPSYVLFINKDGAVVKINLDQYPGEIVFLQPAYISIGEMQDLVFTGGGIHMHIEKSGKFRLIGGGGAIS